MSAEGWDDAPPDAPYDFWKMIFGLPADSRCIPSGIFYHRDASTAPVDSGATLEYTLNALVTFRTSIKLRAVMESRYVFPHR